MEPPVNRGYFQWDIFNPFQPIRELEATFFHFIFTGQAFKVVLEPLDRNINRWEFSVALTPRPRFGGFYIPENLVIFIKRDDNLVSSQEVPSSHFREDNQWTYHFQGEIEMIPEPKVQHFQIKIEFDFEDHVAPNVYFFNEVDLVYLSNAMLEILKNEENNMNPNMVVRSANNEEAFRVHSYILYWRWNNLFRAHPGVRDIHTNISTRVLRRILTYMYCARLMAFNSLKSQTELCQVIDRYEIDHLYRALVINESQQQRVTLNCACSGYHIFPLEISASRTDPSFVWEFDPHEHESESEDSEYCVTLRIQLRNEANNWCSYSLQSRSRGQIFVEVNLEVVKKRSRRAPQMVIPFVGQDYAMEPDQTVDSGPIRRPEAYDGAVRNTFLRCFLRVSTGEKVEMICSVDTQEYQPRNERFQVLSDHMRKLSQQRMFAEMMARSREIRGETQTTRAMHHDFLRARVPRWWNGFKNGSPDRMGCYVESILSRRALHIVFNYIYAGKLRPSDFPLSCLDEVENFAAITGFRVFSNWLRRFRNLILNR